MEDDLLMLFYFMFLALAASAAGLRVEGTTPTSIVVSYVPSGGALPACSVEASESSTFAPLAETTDSSKVSNAATDTAGAHPYFDSAGRRYLVIGQKKAEKHTAATNTTMISRALAAGTRYFIRICGTNPDDVVSATTADVPHGATNPNIQPWDANGVWNWAYPTIRRDAWTVDPLTGVKIRGLTSDSDNAYQVTVAADTTHDPSSGWTNDANVLWAASGAASTWASTSTNDPLYVMIDPAFYGNYCDNMDDSPRYSCGYLQLEANGSSSDGATNLKVCLSYDHQVCTVAGLTESYSIALSSTSHANLADSPSSQSTWIGFPQRDQWSRRGTISCTSGSCTNASITSASAFDHRWVSQTKIYIAGSSGTCTNSLCTVSSVTSAGALVLVESLTITSAAWKYMMAIRLWRSGSGTVDFTMRLKFGGAFQPDLSGNMYRHGACAPWTISTSVDAQGNAAATKTGELCQFMTRVDESIGYGVYAIFSDGESRLVSYLKAPAAIGGYSGNDLPQAGVVGTIGWDQSVAGRAVAVHPCADGAMCIWQLNYAGDYRACSAAGTYQTAFPGTPGNCAAAEFTWTPLTAGTRDANQAVRDNFATIGYCVAASTPHASCPAGFGEFSTDIVATVSGELIFLNHRGWAAQESIASYVAVFKLNGDYLTGFNTINTTGLEQLRYCAHHAIVTVKGQSANTVTMSCNVPAAGGYYGPYTFGVSHVKKSGSYNTDTSIAATIGAGQGYDSTCPASGLPAQYASLHGTENCAYLRITGDPCKATQQSSPSDVTMFPCGSDGAKTQIQALAVGQRFMASTCSSFRCEQLRILELPGGGYPKDITVQRNAMPTTLDPNCADTRGFTNGWTAAMSGQSSTACAPMSFWVHVNSTTGALSITPWYATFVDHYHDQVGPTGLRLTNLTSSYKTPGFVSTAPDVAFASSPSFAGVSSVEDGLQTYPHGEFTLVPAAERVYGLNWRYPSYGATTITQVSGKIWRVTAMLGTIDPKVRPAQVAAGRWHFKEKSSATTGDTLTTLDDWKFCYALAANECRTGSSAGHLYMVIPAYDGTTPAACTYPLAVNRACAFAPHHNHGAGIRLRVDRSGPAAENEQRMTQWQPALQHRFNNFWSLPGGRAMTRMDLPNGTRYDMVLFDLPKWRDRDSIRRDGFQKIPITIATVSGTGTHVEIEFGYSEFGGPTDFYCTARAERCVTDGAASHGWAFVGQTRTYQSPGTITLPLISGRVAFYRVRRITSGGTLVATGPIQVMAVQ